MNIGIFDSGIGGLSVLKEINRILPDESIIYLGDTARVPYGDKSEQLIIQHALKGTEIISRFEIKALVIACNTASSYSLPTLKKKFNFPIIGVIKPAVKAALQVSRNRKIAVIGTEATIGSGVYHRNLKQLDSNIEVISKPCPLFVALVEEGWVDGEITEKIIGRYLSELLEENVDTIILGCTHYPFLKNTILRYIGNNVILVDSGIEVALGLKQLLVENGLLTDKKQESIKYLVTDNPERFKTVGTRLLGRDIKDVERI